jgi:hypothetical protein
MVKMCSCNGVVELTKSASMGLIIDIINRNLDRSLSIHSFRVIGPLDGSRLDMVTFLRSFFSNPTVLRSLQVLVNCLFVYFNDYRRIIIVVVL